MTLISMREAGELFGKSPGTIRSLVKKFDLKRHYRVKDIGTRPRVYVSLLQLSNAAKQVNWHVPEFIQELNENIEDIRVVIEKYKPHLLE